MWSWSKRLLAGAVLSAASFAANHAQAEEKARLVYARAQGTSCPAEIELRMSVVARLGYDPFSPQASRVVLARVERRAHRLVGVVELVDQEGSSSGRRELFAARGHCTELARALALSISLTIDAERALARRSSNDVADVGASVSGPEAAVEPEPASEREPVPAAVPRLFTGAMLAGAQGLLPGFALGGSLYLGVGWRLLSLRLEARFMQSFHRNLVGGATLEGRTVHPGLAGCRSLDRIDACVVGQLGIMRVRSHDEPYPRVVSKLHAAVGPRFTLYFPGDRFSWLVGLEGMLNVSFTDVRMHTREVWRSPLISGTLVAGVETNFL